MRIGGDQSMVVWGGQASKVAMRKRFVIALALCVLLVACGDSSTPGEQIRRTVEQLEAAAEARDVGDVMAHISAGYRDAHGHSPDELSRYLRGYFIAHPSIHLLTRIEQLDFPSADEARGTLVVGMAGREGEGAAAWDLAADLQQFELVWVREKEQWKVRYAAWRQP